MDSAVRSYFILRGGAARYVFRPLRPLLPGCWTGWGNLRQKKWYEILLKIAPSCRGRSCWEGCFRNHTGVFLLMIMDEDGKLSPSSFWKVIFRLIQVIFPFSIPFELSVSHSLRNVFVIIFFHVFSPLFMDYTICIYLFLCYTVYEKSGLRMKSTVQLRSAFCFSWHTKKWAQRFAMPVQLRYDSVYLVWLVIFTKFV